jgi:hypothetical protein
MQKLIVHLGTGTVVDANECLTIDTEKLSVEQIAVFQFGSDSEISRLVSEIGTPVSL